MTQIPVSTPLDVDPVDPVEPRVRAGWLSLQDSDSLPGDIRSAFMVGSRARGWAHAKSDVDVNIITLSPFRPPSCTLQSTSLSDSPIAVVAAELGGLRWELKFWTETQVLELLGRVGWRSFDPASAPYLSANECFLLQRLPHGRTLEQRWHPANSALAEEVREGAFYSITALDLMAKCDGDLEDVAGLLAVGDYSAAALAAVRAFHGAVDAFTASRGDPGSEEKWRRRRVEAVNSAALPVDLYWRLETFAGYSEAAPQAWIDRVVRVCHHLLMQSPVGAPLSDLAHIEPLPARASPACGGRTARLADGATVRTFRDRSFLLQDTRSVEVADTGQAMVAGLLRGDSLAEMAERIAQQFGIEAEDVAPDAADLLADLVGSGYLVEESG